MNLSSRVIILLAGFFFGVSGFLAFCSIIANRESAPPSDHSGCAELDWSFRALSHLPDYAGVAQFGPNGEVHGYYGPCNFQCWKRKYPGHTEMLFHWGAHAFSLPVRLDAACGLLSLGLIVLSTRGGVRAAKRANTNR